MSLLGLNPAKKVRSYLAIGPLACCIDLPRPQAKVVTLPSVEGSYGVVYGNGPYGWDAEGLAAAELAAGVLNALESYFWVSNAIPVTVWSVVGISCLLFVKFRNISEAQDLHMARPSRLTRRLDLLHSKSGEVPMLTRLIRRPVM
jgi:hypothetical protein